MLVAALNPLVRTENDRMNNTSDVLGDLLSVVLSIMLLLLIHRLGGERLREALGKLRTGWIRWLILAALVLLIVCLFVFR